MLILPLFSSMLRKRLTNLHGVGERGRSEELARGARASRVSKQRAPYITQVPATQATTVEPRFNEHLYNEVLGITNDILQPGQSYSEIYGTEPRYNEPRYNEILVIMHQSIPAAPIPPPGLTPGH